MKKLSLRIIIFICMLGIYASANAQDIYTFAGMAGSIGYSGDGGSAILAQLGSPRGVVADAAGNLYFCDYTNDVVRKVSAAGIITTIAGTGTGGYSGDGGAATLAQLRGPIGIAIDGTGNIYVGDSRNNVVRKITTSGNISTIAGNATPGYGGDGGPATAAQLTSPRGLAISSSGNLYIADAGNYVVRMVNTSGTITTMAGDNTAGYSGDGGPATAAMLREPIWIALDATGNIYISDYTGNNVRKVNTAGIISTIAGTGVAGYSGDGGAATAAQIAAPTGIAIDASGNVYIADQGNGRVRKINTSGVIYTAVGNGTPGYYGDGGLATLAEINNPTGLCIDASGNIYIGDTRNDVVRRVGAAVLGITIATATEDTVCAGASTHFRATAFVDLTPHYQWQVNGTNVGTDSAGYTYTPHTGDRIDCILQNTAGGTELAISETLVVDSFPSAGIILGPTTICVGSSVNLRDSVTDTAGGFGPPGIWTNYDTVTTSLTMPSLLTGLAVGGDTVLYTVSNACGTSVAIFNLTIVPNTNGPISGPSTVCAGDTATYTDPTAGGMWRVVPAGRGGANINNTTGLFMAGRRPGLNLIEYGTPGCYATDTVTVLPTPRVSPVTGPNTTYDGVVITLVDTSAGGTWSSADNSIATVDASGNVTGVASGMVGISYSVTNAAGCTGYFIDTITVLGTNGVKNVHDNTSFRVFPNPASGSVTIGWLGQIPGSASLIISDVTGREVMKNELSLQTANGQLTLDISSLKTGVYMIAIKSGNTYLCTKLVIE